MSMNYLVQRAPAQQSVIQVRFAFQENDSILAQSTRQMNLLFDRLLDRNHWEFQPDDLVEIP